MSGVLIDSNIFVYAFDPADPDKHEKALQLIEEVTLESDLVLSVQVLNELAWTLLRQGQISAWTLKRFEGLLTTSIKARVWYR